MAIGPLGGVSRTDICYKGLWKNNRPLEKQKVDRKSFDSGTRAQFVLLVKIALQV
jgi:hypothetical protein